MGHPGRGRRCGPAPAGNGPGPGPPALRPVALRVGVPTALTLAVIVALGPAGTLGVVAAAAAAVVVLAVGAAVFGYLTRARWGWDGPSRQLRRRARHETRVAATLDPLESDWVGDAARPPRRRPPGAAPTHRPPRGGTAVPVVVRPPGPHPLLGPPSTGPHHSAVEWVLTLPATVLLLHQLPHLSATADPVIDDTNVSWAAAAWARHTLAARLATDPTLDGWTVLVFAHLALLHRPPDRWAPPADHHRVGYHDTGVVLRRYLEHELPGALTRRAAAYLATIVDDNCPPASPPRRAHPRRHQRRPMRRRSGCSMPRS